MDPENLVDPATLNAAVQHWWEPFSLFAAALVAIIVLIVALKKLGMVGNGNGNGSKPGDGVLVQALRGLQGEVKGMREDLGKVEDRVDGFGQRLSSLEGEMRSEGRGRRDGQVKTRSNDHSHDNRDGAKNWRGRGSEEGAGE